MPPIEIARTTVEELKVSLPLFSRHMASRGYVARVILTSGIAATEAWESKRGKLSYIAGSLRLFERYHAQPEARRA